MDYQKHYDRLIERARYRVLVDCYTEWHHVKPRCLGGTDDNENLVALTPEEHYVAHQLLVKLNPGHYGLVYAASMMCVESSEHKENRSNNKLHGWLRRKLSEDAKKRMGEKNGATGSFWITDGKNNKRIKDENLIPGGWRRGRILSKEKTLRCCKCSVAINGSANKKYCDPCRNVRMRNKKTWKKRNSLKNVLTDEHIKVVLQQNNLDVSLTMVQCGYANPKSSARTRFNTLKESIS